MSIQYSIGDKQCHAVCNLPNNKRHIFAVGSCCLKRPNEVSHTYLLDPYNWVPRNGVKDSIVAGDSTPRNGA